MNRLSPVLVLLALLSACASAATAPGGTSPSPGAAPSGGAFITAVLDLAAISNDRLLVELNPVELDQDEVLFRLPRVVQGTYAVSDFGSYVEELAAFDGAGAPMAVERVDTNTWRIGNARRLDRLTYYVNDTFDRERAGEEAPFSPSGTNIAPDVFVLNLHGFVGYFEGLTERSYEIRVTAPTRLERSSALPVAASDTSATGGTFTDVYRAGRYFDVTDNPMMYGEIDTVVFPVGDIRITLSVYSPTGAHSAAGLQDDIAAMMAAQSAYLGDFETTDRYDIYLFLAGEDNEAPTGFGALEHHTSTVTVLPEYLPDADMTDAMVDIISHEFFHIIAPLTVHSEDVHDFDYNAPTFSKHLWMYEGITEYFASHFQVYEGLESREDFYEKLGEKIEYAAGYDDAMSFTMMSENVIESPYAENYGNVYQKGALIGMCLDLILRAESGGERSMLSVMKELSARYGIERAFEDDALIAELTEMTYPPFGAFLQTHVAGSTPIGYADCLDDAGIEVVETELPVTLFFLDQQIPFIDANPGTGEIFFREMQLNSTLRAIGAQAGDVVRSVNGQPFTLETFGPVVQASFQWSPEAPVEIVVLRDEEEVVLRGTMGTPVIVRSSIEEDPDATPAQRALRDAWLGG
ncbi:MAG: peptidase M61 [Gemmatimonadota bacterium]